MSYWLTMSLPSSCLVAKCSFQPCNKTNGRHEFCSLSSQRHCSRAGAAPSGRITSSSSCLFSSSCECATSRTSTRCSLRNMATQSESELSCGFSPLTHLMPTRCDVLSAFAPAQSDHIFWSRVHGWDGHHSRLCVLVLRPGSYASQL